MTSNLDSESKSQKVLIVDDREDNLFAMKTLLGALNIDVYTAKSGNEALALMLHHDFAVALLDVQMPKMDGYELATLMRGNKQTSETPIVFLTANSKEQKHIFKGYEVGAVDYLLKPIDNEIVQSKVNVFCSMNERKQERSEEVDKQKRISKENSFLIAELHKRLIEKEFNAKSGD